MNRLLILLVWLSFTISFAGRANSTKPKIATTFIGADVIAYALLEDDLDRLVAVSPLARDKRYSPIYKLLPESVNTFGEELENLILLKPELVITASYTRAEWLKMLDLAKIKTLQLQNFQSLQDIKTNIRSIGKALGENRKASQIVERMDQRLGQLQRCPLRGKKILNYNPEGTLFGDRTTYHDMFESIGAINLAAQVGIKGWAQVPTEQLLAMQPDFVVMGGEESDRKKLLINLRKAAGWQHLQPVKEGKVIIIPSRYLSSVTHWALKALEIACGQI